MQGKGKVQIRIMIENEIYCYVNGLLQWNISKEASYIVGNKNFFGNICILNFRNKKSILVRVIIRKGEKSSQRKRARL